MIKPISWAGDTVVILDQKALPHEERYIYCRDYHDVLEAMKDLTVRGAPALGIAAAMGIALGVSAAPAESKDALQRRFYAICDEFAQTRPTAVNLFWAIDRMKACYDRKQDSSIGSIKGALVEEAIRICDEDIASNRLIGFHGKDLIKDGDSILTHCNAGALATGGFGTALGIIRAARDEGKSLHVYVDETRPILQGARLTCWEMRREEIPATLITDNMAGFVMKRGKVNLVIVGADRIAANGDAANKIGTYTLAVLSKEHGIPFYVAAPLSTVDMKIATGDEIPIEERNGSEVLTFEGKPTAPEGIGAYNPAFDVTPGDYLTAIITEAGIARPPYEESLREFMKKPKGRE